MAETSLTTHSMGAIRLTTHSMARYASSHPYYGRTRNGTHSMGGQVTHTMGGVSHTMGDSPLLWAKFAHSRGDSPIVWLLFTY
jgi:hypothetical protein